MSAEARVAPAAGFETLNGAFGAVFRLERLSVGLVLPLEAYAHGAPPTLTAHLERVRHAESLGFSAVWLRDIPFHVPSFGDDGQVLDPFVYLGALAMATSRIALGVASVVLPLRHPAHVAKAAASADVLSGGRLLLGLASGDRPEEFAAFGVAHGDRGRRFRESFDELRAAVTRPARSISPYHATGGGLQVLPKPTAARVPLLPTGLAQQTPDWLARHGDGWITYPRPAAAQRALIERYRDATRAFDGRARPVMEPLYVDLLEDDRAPPSALHLGYRLGPDRLVDHLRARRALGVNHVALNLRFNRADVTETLERLATDVLPELDS